MTDRASCFSQLQKEVPRWLESVHLLEERAQSAPPNPEPRGLAPHRRQLWRKPSSLESIQTAKGNAVPPSKHQTPPAEPSSSKSRQASRHPDPDSIRSGRVSSPDKALVDEPEVVYYDGDVQKRLERLVRDIASARNMLRKAKTVARMEAISAENMSLTAPTTDGMMAAVPAVLNLADKLAGPRMPTLTAMHGSTRSATAMFDAADKALETSQACTEKAAYRFLKHGEAAALLGSVQARMREAQNIAASQNAWSRFGPSPPPPPPPAPPADPQHKSSSPPISPPTTTAKIIPP